MNTFMKIAVSEQATITVKVEMPASIGAETPALILAHGANNDLDHPLLVTVAREVAAQAGALVVRFNFPYSERGASSPDSAPVLENAFLRVRDHVVDAVAAPGAPLLIGGKSMGGRIAAELLSRGDEDGGITAAGLVELGYPLHRPGHKEKLFTEPLRRITGPSLFLIGERDPFCDVDLLRPLLAGLLLPARLVVVPGGDHSLHRAGVGHPQPERTGETVAPDGAKHNAPEFAEVAAEVARFVAEVAGGPSTKRRGGA
jgi:predicted alpha/beta-hydrolase family hydrolase